MYVVCVPQNKIIEVTHLSPPVQSVESAHGETGRRSTAAAVSTCIAKQATTNRKIVFSIYGETWKKLLPALSQATEKMLQKQECWSVKDKFSKWWITGAAAVAGDKYLPDSTVWSPHLPASRGADDPLKREERQILWFKLHQLSYQWRRAVALAAVFSSPSAWTSH